MLVERQQTKIAFYSMLFDAEGGHPDPEKVEAIQEPQDTQELQTLLGIAT